MTTLVPEIIRRFETIVETAAGAHTPLRKTAQNISERALWAGRVELSMQALTAACMTLLEVDEGGRSVNVDGATGRILVAMPWGKAGGVQWGLRSSEQRVLALVLRWRAAQDDALFVLDRQAWYVEDFTRRRAEHYLRTRPISIGEYRDAWELCAIKWARKSARRSSAYDGAPSRARQSDMRGKANAGSRRGG